MISLKKDIADIYGWETVTDEWGQSSKNPVIKYENIKCTLSKKNISNLTNEPITTSMTRYLLFIPYDIDVEAGDKIVIKNRDITFKAQTPFKYPFLKKQELEVEIWQE